jgi:SAM-dependent methyltransferase
LDLGGWDGAHIHAVLQNSPVQPHNVYVADINQHAVSQASARFGFIPVVLPEGGRLPFADAFFDLVFCSSVIEHVTVPKEMVWSMVSGTDFREIARRRQGEFASEIRRLGKGYFVQAPYRWWPIETHSWLPFFNYLPRRLQVPLLRVTNRFWIKQTRPDFHLPNEQEMKQYFPDAVMCRERVLGITKSLICYRSA